MHFWCTVIKLYRTIFIIIKNRSRYQMSHCNRYRHLRHHSWIDDTAFRYCVNLVRIDIVCEHTIVFFFNCTTATAFKYWKLEMIIKIHSLKGRLFCRLNRVGCVCEYDESICKIICVLTIESIKWITKYVNFWLLFKKTKWKIYFWSNYKWLMWTKHNIFVYLTSL